MNNYFCILSYLGASYFGFERQKNHASIQGKVEECLSAILNENIKIAASGRTDAKVNAKGQTFTFKSEAKLLKDKKRFLYAINHVLPSDINIISLEKVDDDFHARYSALKKRYSYSFKIGEKDPFLSCSVAMLGDREFDKKAFHETCLLFLGEHNFQDFTSKSEDLRGFFRTIYEISPLKENSGIYKIEIVGDGFMTYQVRTMIGAALKVAWGKCKIEDVSARLDSKERKILTYKAPPEGLCLEEVYYK